MASNKNKKKKQRIYEQTRKVSDQLNRHGRLKGKKRSKKEMQEIRSICMHHGVKNGRVKNRIIDNMDGTGTCRICGAKFPFEGPTKKEYKEKTQAVCTDIELLKWTCQSAGVVDQKSVDYLCKLDYMLFRFPKIASKIQKQYTKVRETMKKKKNRGYANKSGSPYGQWADNYK